MPGPPAAVTTQLNPYQMRQSAIGRGPDHWDMYLKREGVSLRDFIVRMLTERGRNGWIPLALSKPTGAPVFARINNNRWLADSPEPKCVGAEVVDPANPSFYCLSCYNVSNGGRPRPVTFPNPGILRAIEVALLKRLDIFERNWVPGQSVSGLEAENAAFLEAAQG